MSLLNQYHLLHKNYPILTMTVPVSIQTRMQWVSSFLLLLFFGIAGTVIDRSYFHSTLDQLKERLGAQVIALIAATEEISPGKFQLSYPLKDLRFFEKDSGVYAAFFQNHGKDFWMSPSSRDERGFFIRELSPGRMQFGMLKTDKGRELIAVAIGVQWDSLRPAKTQYTFSVSQDMKAFRRELMRFRQILWGGLAAIGILLLVLQRSVLKWGLSPLHGVVNELDLIKAGQQSCIQNEYPKELSSLTRNINALLETQSEHLSRHRNALGDLAHSLKTPLAVIQSSEEGDCDEVELRKILRQQAGRMRDIIEHQLRRAATAGHLPLSGPIKIAEITNKIIQGLAKVYAEKDIHFETKLDPDVLFYGDEGDLYELLGNVLDNACKWCEKRLSIEVSQQVGKEGDSRHSLIVVVEDDGPGVSDDCKRDVMQRGVKQFKEVPGQGIGLAVAQEIVGALRGRIEIFDSPRYGGAGVRIELPDLG